ncbi:MAG: TonB-dependent receptor [Maricaulaceae bacterium]
MSYKNSLILSASLIASSFVVTPQLASAQDESAFKIDEIVVTARKREESLQDVPLAVTALDKAAIDNLHTSTITGIDRLVPNIDLGDNPFTGLGLAAVIRGIGSSDPEKTFEPTVGLSIDGVFLASNTGAAIDAFDLEYAEVLRGPQGTLFGRNTVGGVINVRRSRPTGEAGLKLGTRITNHSGREYFAVANLPAIDDVLSTKLYAFSKEHDTFATNTVTGEKDDQKDLLQFGGALLVEPNDKFEALISFDYFDDDSFGPPGFNLNSALPLAQGGDLFCNFANGGIIVAGQPTALQTGAGCASTSIDVAEASDFEEFTRATPFVTNIDGWSLTSNIEYDLNENLTLTSVTGYRETNDTQSNSTADGALAIPSPVIVGPPAFVPPLFIFGDQPFDVGLNFRNFESSQFSQELRLSGVISDKFDFVAGLYYLNSDYNLVGGEFEPGVFGTARPFNQTPPNNETVAQQANAYAAFIDITYPLTDRLSLSGGLRYSYEEKDFQFDFLFRGPDALGNPSPITGTSADASDNWQAPTWRATLQYDVSDDINVYGGYTRGFRSGGFNGRAATAEAAATSFDEETVDSFEIGARTEFFDNRLRINPTAFLAIYDDKQEDTLVTTGTGANIVNSAIVDNVSQVDIKGVELEVLARITENLTFQGTFGHVDAEFDEFLAPEVIGVNPTTGAPILGDNLVDVSDERNLRAGPDTTFTVGATYDRLIFDGKLGMTLDASYNFQSDIVTSALQDPLGLGRDRVDGNKGFDFSASVTNLGAGPKITLTGFINDAFDSDAGRLGTSVVIPGIFTFGVGVPTTVYGLDATVEF